jgi:stress response protein SCP2
MFGARRRAEDLEAELARTRALLQQVGGMDAWQREQHRRHAEQQLGQVLHEERAARDRVAAAHHELDGLERQLVETREAQLLQEAGVYDYAHPLDTAVAYKDALARLRADLKKEVSERRAVTGSVSWTVNGSRREGAKMVKDFSTLMLRAYNAEADNCVRTVKPHTRASVLARLGKTRATIARLGTTMSIAIAEHYHRLRIREIELTADHLAKVETEREFIRAQKEAAREEERARRDFERQKAKLLKEQAHYANAYDRLIAQPGHDPAAAAQLRGELERLGADIATVEARAANTRAGYVYVISNIGSFGDQVVKIGMTRRLEPMDRVRELGDASVPFRFDVHALIFSDDAVGLETRLHAALAEQRINKVNTHREFFRTTPVHVRDLLVQTARSHVLEFTETVEAPEWRASGAHTSAAPLPPEPVLTVHPSEDADPDPDPDPDSATPAAPPGAPPLSPGSTVPLPSANVRLLIGAPIDTTEDVEIDPVAFLLSECGTVRSDDDMVFYGQPDHPTGAITLAADDTGTPTALALHTDLVPADISEILLTAQTSPGHCLRAEITDSQQGSLGHVALPAAGPTGLLQIGALHRTPNGWALLVHPDARTEDLTQLATAAGIDVA